MGVHQRHMLYIEAVLDNQGRMMEYKKRKHALGLLYCASMNTSTNDHMAQFVRGAHTLMVFAVLLLVAVVLFELVVRLGFTSTTELVSSALSE